MSYHLTEIAKGVLGELSKIQEELDEIKDAEQQNNKIMIGCELSDLYGAVEAYANKFGLTMDDLSIMSEATKRAFKSGRRVSIEEEAENHNLDLDAIPTLSDYVESVRAERKKSKFGESIADKEKEAITLTRYDYDVDEENAVFVVYKLSNSPGYLLVNKSDNAGSIGLSATKIVNMCDSGIRVSGCHNSDTDLLLMKNEYSDITEHVVYLHLGKENNYFVYYEGELIPGGTPSEVDIEKYTTATYLIEKSKLAVKTTRHNIYKYTDKDQSRDITYFYSPKMNGFFVKYRCDTHHDSMKFMTDSIHNFSGHSLGIRIWSERREITHKNHYTQYLPVDIDVQLEKETDYLFFIRSKTLPGFHRTVGIPTAEEYTMLSEFGNVEFKIKKYSNFNGTVYTRDDKNFYIMRTKQSPEHSLQVVTKEIKNLNPFKMTVNIDNNIKLETFEIEPGNSLTSNEEFKATILGTDHHSILFICSGEYSTYNSKIDEIYKSDEEKYQKIFDENMVKV